jgi:hypothetical protein
MADHCPTCGSPVQVVGSDEGTSHYEPLTGGAARLRPAPRNVVELPDPDDLVGPDDSLQSARVPQIANVPLRWQPEGNVAASEFRHSPECSAGLMLCKPCSCEPVPWAPVAPSGESGPLRKALLNVERAAREVDAFFGGKHGRWTFERKVLGEDDGENAATALLSLHDYLNDATMAREALAAVPAEPEPADDEVAYTEERGDPDDPMIAARRWKAERDELQAELDRLLAAVDRVPEPRPQDGERA